MPAPSHPSPSRPLRVAYDLARLTAGGTNGGIKTHHYAFLRALAERHGHEIALAVFCREEVVPELSFLAAGPYNQLHILGPRGAFDPRQSDGRLPPLRYWPERPKDLLARLDFDLLYCGFGFSELSSPDVPQISLIVDALHRSFPECLPNGETRFRESWYREAIDASALVQTNSEYCKQQLVNDFGANPDKVFTISLPLHHRFNGVEMGELPAELQPHRHRYFLYPANFWPHKNHETLLVGYQLYLRHADPDDPPWRLVLVGPPSERRDFLQQTAGALGIEEEARFLDHLELSDFKALWELAAALVFPSLYEGFGIPLLEAMHFQKPILAADCPSTRWLLKDARCQTFDPISPESIARSLADAHRRGAERVDNSDTLHRFGFETELSALRERLLSFRKPSPSPAT